MLPLMATEREIQSQWNRYGSCSGLDQQQYFELVERARRKPELTQVYDAPERRIESSHDEVLQKFSPINPDLRDSFALDCRRHWLRFVQVRSEERRLGQACVSNGSSRWSPHHSKKQLHH